MPDADFPVNLQRLLLPLLWLSGCLPVPDIYQPDDTAAHCLDEDGDGFGVGGDRMLCAEEEEDCDDGDPGVNPHAQELCDGADNDCDRKTDEADASDQPTWYHDRDSDGYGNPDRTSSSCNHP